MIGLVLFVVGALFVLCSARACDDNKPPGDDSAWLDALLFGLVLIGVIAKHRKQARKDDEESSG